MTNYKLSLIVLLANFTYSQSEKIIPSIVDLDGVVYKSNEEIPYTGKVSTYWENDQLKEEGLYRGGVKSGLWKYWHSEGQLSSKGIFRNNLKTGVWIEFYDNGNKKMQTIYRNGLKNGKQNFAGRPLINVRPLQRIAFELFFLG